MKADNKTTNYKVIYQHYENKLQEFGANHQGMDWPSEQDLATRFKVMVGVTNILSSKEESYSLLDLGCGVGLLVDYIKVHSTLSSIDYQGVDISDVMVLEAKKKYPNESFLTRDILQEPLQDSSSDFVVMNGVLTEKLSMEYESMVAFAKAIIKAAFATCRKGICFNVMNVHVDWQRDDLFHWPMDELMAFLVKDVSRHIVIRADYGLYEYSVYVYKDSNR